ncbi:hypothetical protein FRC02_010323 [Tulasnella sp. 418]|nr:hypothetical protein FRC02_010323 [Tulasnella sp. 418]
MRMMDDVKEIDKMVKGMTFAEAVLWEGGRPKSKKLPIAGTSSKPTTSKSSKATAKSSATKTPTATSRSTKSKNSRTTRNRSSTTKPSPSSDIYEEILTFGLAIFLVLGIMVMLRLQNDNQVAPALHYPRPRGYQQDAPLHLQFETDEDEDGEEEWIDEGPVDDATAEEIRQHDALNPKEDESEKAGQEQESGGGGDCVVCQDKEAIYCFVPCG